MGEHDTTRVDLSVLRAVADQFDEVAQTLAGSVRTQLGRLAFAGASAGRDHVVGGDAVHAALHRQADGLSQWSRASAEIAMTLRAGAGRYADAERYATSRVGAGYGR